MESKQSTNNNGDTYWKLPSGTWHKEDGPAVILSSGSQFWFKYGKSHRLDGPAVIRENGSGFWYINDYSVTDKIHQWAKEMNIDLDNLTDEDKFMIRLYWENYSE